MNMYKFFAISAIVLLVGCTHVKNKEYQFQVGEKVNEFCNLLRNDVQGSVENILKPYGIPDQVDVETVPNKHAAGENDETHTALYGTGKIVVYSVPHIGRNYVLRVILTEDFWPSFLSKHIGKSQLELIEYFGSPDRAIEKNLVYDCAIEVDEYIQFYMVESRVAALEIKGWID